MVLAERMWKEGRTEGDAICKQMEKQHFTSALKHRMRIIKWLICYAQLNSVLGECIPLHLVCVSNATVRVCTNLEINCL